MHISPSLSRKLRDTLGPDAGGDLVTWLDEQREESAQMRADMAELRQEMVAMEARISQRFDRQDTMLAERDAKLAERIGMIHTELVTRISDVKSDLMKWSFVFWCGAV